MSGQVRLQEISGTETFGDFLYPPPPCPNFDPDFYLLISCNIPCFLWMAFYAACFEAKAILGLELSQDWGQTCLRAGSMFISRGTSFLEFRATPYLQHP